MTPDDQMETVLRRFDRSSPDRLLKSIAAEIARLHGEVAELRQQLSSITQHGKALTEPVPPPDGVTIDADERFVGAEGFYHLEHDQLDVAYRWTGPKAEFLFTFTLDRNTPTKCALYFDDLYAGSSVEDLRGFVDGHPMALHVTRAPERGYVATGDLPAREGFGDTVLTFVSPSIASPRDSGHDDDRRLGVSFRLLEVGSAVQRTTEPEGVGAPPHGEAGSNV
jgi:hypothetical protein